MMLGAGRVLVGEVGVCCWLVKKTDPAGSGADGLEIGCRGWGELLGEKLFAAAVAPGRGAVA